MSKKDKAKLAKNAEERKPDPFFAVVAKVYEVPPTGISAIGNQPYLNRDGRLCLLHKKRQGDKAVLGFKTEFLKYSMGAAEPAVVKKVLAFKDGSEYDAIGEAGADNVDSSDVKKTLNMVAETRAQNRVIWLAIGGEVMEMVERNLESMEISQADRVRIIEAGRVSYEEVERPSRHAEAEKPKQDRKLYTLTVERVEEIKQNREKLEKARENLDQVALTPEEKELVREKIDRALEALGGVIQMDAPEGAEEPQEAAPEPKKRGRPAKKA